MVYVFHIIEAKEDVKTVLFYAVATSIEEATKISQILDGLDKKNFCTAIKSNKIFMDGERGCEHHKIEVIR